MAAPCESPAYTVEVHFAQRLAANEKKIRDRAVKRLRQWIGARTRKDAGGVEEGELMRLWKGLFYCMWMCDKPVVQEELADQISDMVHCFHRPKQAIKFYDTFLLTMKREWIGIDHLRMDKYLMLIRRSFRQVLVLLHNNEWDDSLIDLFLDALRRTSLNPAIDACPDGLRYQIANVFLDELAREGTEDLPPRKASGFLVPFAELAAKTLNKKLRDVILEDIFQDVVERSNVGEEEKEEEDEGIASDEERKKKQKQKGNKKKRKGSEVDDDEDDEEEDEEEDDVDILEKVMFPEEMVPPLEYDYEFIAEKLFELASSTTIPPRNRKPIYKMVQRFQSLAKGIYPMKNLLEEIRNEKDNDYLKDDLPWWKKLQAKDKKKKRRKRRRGKKGKGNEGEDGDEDNEDEVGDNDDDKEEVVKKKRKKMVEATRTTPDDVAKGTSEKKKKKNRKQKASEDDNEDKDFGDDDGLNEGKQTDEASSGQTTDLSSGSTSYKRKKKNDKKNKQKGVGDEGMQEKDSIKLTLSSSVTDVDLDSGKSLTSASSKKGKGKKRKSAAVTEDVERSQGTENVEFTKSSKNLEASNDIVTQKDTHIAERNSGANNLSANKTKNKKQKRKSDVPMAPVSPVVTESPTGDGSAEDHSLNLEDVSKVLFSDDSPGTQKPFATFEKVVTPPAYVKKSKAKQAEVSSTLPRAKAKSKQLSEFSPPMTRKRVKIALSKNEVQAANDYKERIKLSPGVPFDSTKKPSHSVLKQTPTKLDSATPVIRKSLKGLAKSAKASAKSQKKRRSKATDFF